MRPFASKNHLEKCRQLVADGKMSQEYFDQILEVTDVSKLPEQSDYQPRGRIRGYRRERKEAK